MDSRTMDYELNYEGTDSPASSSDSPSTISQEAAEEVSAGSHCGANLGDPMVTVELEAAEAIAGLAHFSIPESSTRGWNEDERPSQRLKTESPPGDSATEPEALDLAVVDQHQSKNTCSTGMKTVKVERDVELLKPSPCTSSYASFYGYKSRKKLTEAEKEAKRVRRVLANRESARQTIRRRQALYEELTRKARSVEWENKNLKREKELAVKEYDSLKCTNAYLKAEMAKTMMAEVEETLVNSKSTNVEIATSSCTSCPFLICGQPAFSPFVWPAITQPSNAVQLQHGSQNALVVPSKFSMPVIAKPDSFRSQEYSSAHETPLYLLPYPCFFPYPMHGNEFHLRPSFDLNNEPVGASMNNQCGANSLSQSCHPWLPTEVEAEASYSTEGIPMNKLHEIQHGFPPDGGGQHAGLHPKGAVFRPAPLKAVMPVSILNETAPQPDHGHNVHAFSLAVGRDVNPLSEMTLDPSVNPSRKDRNAVAAEARKKRKELMKLKRLHFC